MAGAMRRMGIYLGLVEDDDARAYGRYDAHQGDADRYDRLEERRYSRYASEDGYDDRYDVEERYDSDYRGEGYRDGDYRADDRFADLDADELAGGRYKVRLARRLDAGNGIACFGVVICDPLERAFKRGHATDYLRYV